MLRQLVGTAASAAGKSIANSTLFAKTVGNVAERVNMTEVVHTVGHGAKLVSAVTGSAINTLDRQVDRFAFPARLGMATLTGTPTGILAGSVYAADHVSGSLALLITAAGVATGWALGRPVLRAGVFFLFGDKLETVKGVADSVDSACSRPATPAPPMPLPPQAEIDKAGAELLRQ
jgi:hypothetical protein